MTYPEYKVYKKLLDRVARVVKKGKTPSDQIQNQAKKVTWRIGGLEESLRNTYETRFQIEEAIKARLRTAA